jgi:hypothetical protein
VDLLNSVPLEEADMAKFRQVLDVNIMAAVLVSDGLMRYQDPRSSRLVYEVLHYFDERAITARWPDHQQR